MASPAAMQAMEARILQLLNEQRRALSEEAQQAAQAQSQQIAQLQAFAARHAFVGVPPAWVGAELRDD